MLILIISYWMKNFMKIFWFTRLYTKYLRIIFNKRDGFIRLYDRSRYLVLFSPEKYDAIYDKIRYLMNLERDIPYVFNDNYAKIKIDVLPLGWTFPNVIIHIMKITYLQRNNFMSYRTSWRRFEDIFKSSRKTSWRRLGRRKIVSLKTSSRRSQNIYWRRFDDMFWRRLEGMSWRGLKHLSRRRLEDVLVANKLFTGDICI